MSSPLGWSASQCIGKIQDFTPTTKRKAMAWVAESNAKHGTDGLAISGWDRDRIQQLAAYLNEIDPSREAGALQLADRKLTEVQQVAAAAVAEHLDVAWPVDELGATSDELDHRDRILGLVAEHHDRLAQAWADLDRDPAKMRAAVMTALGFVETGTTIGDVLGSLTIDTTADNDGPVDWEAISVHLLGELIRFHGEVISKAGVIDRELSKLSDAIQDAITIAEAMIPNEGAQ